MPYNEKLPEWLNPGQEPPSTRKVSGWSPQDRPPAEWMNYHQNRTYKALDELQKNAVHQELVGDVSSLPTSEKKIVPSIKEVHEKIIGLSDDVEENYNYTVQSLGDLNELKSLDKRQLVKALNETIQRRTDLYTHIDDFPRLTVETADHPRILRALSYLSDKTAVLNFSNTSNILINSEITIDNPNLIILANKTTFSTESSIKSLKVNRVKSITGAVFDKVRLYLPYNFSSDDTFIAFNEFTNLDQAIYTEFGYKTFVKNLTICFNKFSSCAYGIYGGGIKDSVISFNTFKKSTGRNIEFSCAQGNVFVGNYIDGGVTGIAFLTNRQINVQPTKDNIILFNRIYNVTEESISFDLRGNESGKTGAVKTGSVVSWSSKSIVPDFPIEVPYSYIGMYLYFLTGNLKGRYYSIDYMGADGKTSIQLTKRSNLSDVQAGDKFVIIIPFFNNIIKYNTIKGGGNTGISLWGNCFDNIIEDNPIYDSSLAGISISHLSGMVDGIYAPTGDNVVKGNKLTNCHLIIVSKRYGTSATEYNMYGNVVEDNKITDGDLILSYQDERSYKRNKIIGGVKNETNAEILGRSINPYKGELYWDTILNKWIFFNGINWVDYNGANV
ncbi:NosD domain-containing protein [Priestia aryabhattai]|uniref:NosD domain-containing protein n=1 Tax=Priestia aryabhattai TaxID=412384 RepID=UPI002E1A1D59|nr:hypothetical protein [Priestia aryabhattai]MED4257681.1 hypothetical protein [Priestia aryabhattai]